MWPYLRANRFDGHRSPVQTGMHPLPHARDQHVNYPYFCHRSKITAMAHQPLVSIITIVYNGEKYLEQTIQSVLGQSYPNLEYIIIDGGSRDNSVSIIKKYSDRLAFWMSEKDKGVSDAFNKGIARANGEIIGLINADDWYEPSAVEKVVTLMGDADVAYGDVRYWKDGKKDLILIGNHERLHHEMSVSHPGVFVKSKTYKDHGVFRNEYKYAMDYELLLRFHVQSCVFVHVPDVIANMRWEGLSDQQWHKACKEALHIKNTLLPEKTLVNKIFFHKQVASIKLGHFLHRMNMQGTVRFYRRWLSPVKKRYH